MAEREEPTSKRRRVRLIGLLAVVVAGAGWLVVARPGASSLGAHGECGSGAPVTVAAGRLYDRPWSVTATRGADGAPCFRVRLSFSDGRSEDFPSGLVAAPDRPGEWQIMGLDGSRIVLAFGIAAPGVARYELRHAGAAPERVMPVAYGGVRYFGFAYSTDRLAHYVTTVAGYDAKGRRVVSLDPWSGGEKGPVPRVSALGAPAATIGSGVVEGAYWRMQKLPPKPEATYAKAGFDQARGAGGPLDFTCYLVTVGGRVETPDCGSWPPEVILQPNTPMNGPCQDYGIPTVCAGVVDPRVDHLVLVLADGHPRTLRTVTFHGYRFTAFAYAREHPPRTLTAYDGDGTALATTYFTKS